ncbi:MAG TPA: hypothetical protein VFP72_22475, partial [Kineosporiaceae bacterium]|nr:hypothetical protein [Kineosporiaceae bacterium]
MLPLALAVAVAVLVAGASLAVWLIHRGSSSDQQLTATVVAGDAAVLGLLCAGLGWIGLRYRDR